MVRKILAGVLLSFATGLNATAMPLPQITRFTPPPAVADAFFTQIEIGDLGSAYQLMSADARKRQNISEFQRSLYSLSGKGGGYSHSVYFSGISSDSSMPSGSALACFKAVPRGGYGNMVYLAAILTRPDFGSPFVVERYQVASEPYRECPSR